MWLERTIDTESDELQAVVIVPSRELALQSHDVLARMKCGVRSLCLYGGRPAMEEHRRLAAVKPQVVFATPGRLNDHLGLDRFSQVLMFSTEGNTVIDALQLAVQREGTITTACSALLSLSMSRQSGSRYARVLPDPVGERST